VGRGGHPWQEAPPQGRGTRLRPDASRVGRGSTRAWGPVEVSDAAWGCPAALGLRPRLIAP